MPFKTIIVDDDPIARKSLEKLCEKSSSLENMGIFENGKYALDFLKQNHIDLLFLDIEMPEMTGLELLEQLVVIPQVIITTSKKEYAYEAFEYEVTDFLKKPFSQNRFFKAIEKVAEREEQLNNIASSSALNEIYVKSDGKYIRVPYDQILCFENVGDYIKVCTATKAYVIYGTIKGLDQKLKNPRFIKVHRSYIINLDKVKDVEDNTLVIEKKVIPISRAHKPILMRSLNII